MTTIRDRKLRGKFDILTHSITINESRSEEIRKGILAHEMCHKKWHCTSGKHTLYGKINHWIERRHPIIRVVLLVILFPLFWMEEIDCMYEGIRMSNELKRLHEVEQVLVL